MLQLWGILNVLHNEPIMGKVYYKSDSNPYSGETPRYLITQTDER